MECLHRHTEAERDIRILESKSDGSRLYLDGAVLYTHVDSEGRNRLDYVAAMGVLIDQYAQASMPFSPLEYARSSRKRLVDDLREKLGAP